MTIGYLVSEDGTSIYSGRRDQRIFMTLTGAEKRVKKVKELTGKVYKIRKMDFEE